MELFDELYGDSSRELREQLYEHYQEEVELGNIVACVQCGQDCRPEEGAEKDEDLTCETCLEQEEEPS
jgi:uracil-DNA glycosylase